jgi:DNA-directed RNA polymerase subunit RPC12/RpoP
MPAVSFSCPECRKVLKSPAAIPAGKKIRCPGCSKVFAMPELEDQELAEAIQEKPRPPKPAPRRAREEEQPDEAPRRRTKVAAPPVEEEELQEELPEADEREEEEERPRKKKRGKKQKRRSGALLWLLLGGMAAMLLLLVGGAGVGAYFLWFFGINRGTGDEDPLAYIPPNASLIMGFDYPAVLNDSVLGPQLEDSIRKQSGTGNYFDELKKGTGLEFKELFAQAIFVVDLDLNNPGNAFGGGLGPIGGGRPGVARPGAVNTQQTPPMTVIVKSSKPFSQRKIAQHTKDAVRKSQNGKTYYSVSESGFKTLYMPSDRIIVLSHRDISQLGSILSSDGASSSASASTTTLIRAVQNSTMWLVVPFEGELKKKMDTGLAQEPPPPEIRPLVDAAAKGTGAVLWGTLSGDKVKIGVGLGCADEVTASHTSRVAKDLWTKQRTELGQLEAMLLFVPSTKKAYEELMRGLQFSTRGNLAEVTTEANRKTLTDAFAELQKAGQQRNNPGR